MEFYINTVIIVAIALMSAVITLLGLSLKNLFDDMKEKLSVREHVEYKEQIKDRWIAQAEINRQAIEAYMQVKSYDAWKQEFDLSRDRQEKLDSELRRRIDALERARGN